jgi:uncharacterized protein YkwD
LTSSRRFLAQRHSYATIARMRRVIGAAALLALLAVVSDVSVAQQQANLAVEWQVVVNQARGAEGLPPYGHSALLSQAAQRHADDLASNQLASHTGSDGSTSKQRIAESGYAAWTWSGGELITGENFWTGFGTVGDAMAFFAGDPPHRKNLLNSAHREMGIGVAQDVDGRNYYVLDFGARPNVLPVFINDGAATTENPQVAIRLTNEDARPDGDGSISMGQAIEVRIANGSELGDAPWQPWEPLIPWSLGLEEGEQMVIVEFRDAAGRTAASTDSIVLGPQEVVTATAESPIATPEPTETPVPPSPTPQPSNTPSPTARPTDTPTPEPTSSPTPEPTAGTFTVPEPATTSPESPQAKPHTATPTPFPTWTPVPTSTSGSEAGHFSPIGLLVALQGVAAALGIGVSLRRGDGRTDV